MNLRASCSTASLASPSFLTSIFSVVMAVLILVPTFAHAELAAVQPPQVNSQFPIGPNPTVTPGSLCTTPDSTRYPEHIPYCNRNVTTDLKRQLIAMYDQKFGYQIEHMDRQKFKIDHYIPLCVGGSNNPDNLWPQNESVYTITDPLEAALCEKMAAGRLSQADAVALVRQAKNNLEQAPAIIDHVNSL